MFTVDRVVNEKVRYYMNSIIKKIKYYDENHETEFADIVTEKLEETAKVNTEYRRGVLHGLLLSLTHLGVISASEGIAILDEVQPNEE